MDRRPLHNALTEHQNAIEAMLREADAMLASVDPARAPLIILLRWQLTKRLREYQEFKHVLLFDPLCEGADTAVKRLAFDMRERCTAIGATYTAHLKHWPDDLIERCWDRYKDAGALMILQIRRHLSREREDAEQLLWARVWRAPE